VLQWKDAGKQKLIGNIREKKTGESKKRKKYRKTIIEKGNR
jgi:hypothetical protein